MLREFGVSCGRYDFVWDHFGPISPDISDDMKKEVFLAEAVENINRIMQVELIPEEGSCEAESMQKPKRELVAKSPFHHDSITSFRIGCGQD